MGKRVLGIDENGLGPLMGPLVVTGTLLKQDTADAGWFEDIADSKSFFPTRSLNNFSKIEETAISVFYLREKRLPCSPVEVLKNFCGEPKCFSGANVCTGRIPEKFIWAEPERVKNRCDAFSGWAIKNNVEIEKIRSVCVCPNRINDFVEKGKSKLLLDFLTFCGIVKDVPSKTGLDVQAGKIGGLKFYKTYLRYGLPDYEALTLEEKEEISSYSLQNNRTKFLMNFIMDVEKKSFPAALSSIIGKYVREIFMESIRRTFGIKEDISGYHDRKTRKVLGTLDMNFIPEGCVFRKK